MQGHLVAVRFPESESECPSPGRVRGARAIFGREGNSARFHRATREGRASRCRAREWEPREERLLLRLFPHVRAVRSEEHTSELQSQFHLVCRRLLEKKKPQDRPRGGACPRPALLVRQRADRGG